MEDEGIMALPQGQQPMQNQAPPKKPVYVSSADAYDAALQGLSASTNDPSQAEAVKQAVRESIDELALSPKEVIALLDVLEYMSQHPEEYPQLRQQLLEADMMDEDDLPEEYDSAFLGMAIMVLNEYQASRAEGAQAAMDMSPTVEGLGPMPMAEGGLADMARYLAAQGRNGDTMLAHITPEEARLLKSMGGAGTPNPVTGLPQFFLKKLFKGIKKAVKKILKNPIFRIIATVALATVIGPAAISAIGGLTGAATVAAGTAGAAAGLGGTAFALSTSAAAAASALTAVGTSAAVSAMAGEKLNAKNLLVNAAASYFGAGGNVGQFAPLRMATDLAGRIPGITAGSNVAQSIGSALTSATVARAAGLSSDQALAMGLQSGAGTYFSKLTKPLTGYSDKELTDMGYSEGAIARIRAENAPQATTAPAPPSGAAPTTPATTQTAAEQMGAGAPGAVSTASELPSLSAFAKPPPGMEYDVSTNKFVPIGKVGDLTGTAAVASTYPTGLTFGQRFDRMINPPTGSSFLENASNVFLKNPNAQSILGQYVPAGLTLAGIGAVTGGFKDQPVDQNPLFNRDYTGSDYIRDNPKLFGGSLGRVEGMPAPFNPLVPTSPYGPMPTGTAPTVVPRGVSLRPAGIVQPYNVAGLYGVPDLSAPVEQPIYMNRGGDPSKFPRKTGPINGPGTGTSDSIPAMLSDGEFVFTAKAVRSAGGGSRRKGAKRMYALMKKLEGGAVKG